ncbi:hypothetical protein GCM10010324_11740 [Streptomyces hiroshimensis]|uniref:Uncharacterized protein n=1 Tax=Streptomyces hiroshimensis TaxID=66424 RepID=A0ABQ2Y814_9ACTN|nr:hypothetical protein GCM10010324_11740 [Streptomyces hiroshimensis]
MIDRAKVKSDKDPRQLPVCAPAVDFHTIPHQKLQAMVEHADHHKVFAAALSLNSASQAIKKLGDDLKKHMEGVVWSGEAGEAFRKWGNSMANETLRLGDYVREVDKWMGMASTSLGSARRMPKYSPEDQATVDAWLKSRPLAFGEVPMPGPGSIPIPRGDGVTGGPTQEEAYDAQRRLKENKDAAAELIKALAESYDESGKQILQAVRPNFRPMPDKVMPDRKQIDAPEHVSLPGGESDGSLAAGAARAGYGGSGSSGSVGLSDPSGSTDRPSRRPDLDLSGGIDTPTRVPVPHPGQPPVTPPDAGRPQIPAPHVPTPNWPGPARRPDPGRRPGGSIPDPVRQPTPRIPGPGPVGAGPGRRPDVRVPNTPRDGIVGGRPTARGPSMPTQPPGRAAVFGTEPPSRQGQTRPPMVPGTGFGAVPGPTAVGSGVGGTGRYKVTEPGGVVGGGVAGRSSVGGGSTHFTPGGTGLVRRGAPGEGGGTSSTRQGMAGGFLPAAGAGAVSSDRRTGGRRPDYLVEDEETWQQGGRDVVPPVIE